MEIIEEQSSKTIGGKWLNILENIFEKIGRFTASYPIPLLVFSIILWSVLCVGLMRATIVTDPEELWVPLGTRSVEEQDYYDEMFGPFYRVSQIIYTSKQEGGNVAFSDLILELNNFEVQLNTMQVPYGDSFITLKDVCYQVVVGPNQPCVINTVRDYWYSVFLQDYTLTTIVPTLSDDDIIARLQEEALTPLLNKVDPPLVLGGPVPANFTAFTLLQAFETTYLLNAYPSNVDKAMAWESAYLNACLVQSQNSNFSKIYYSAERSLQDEINRLISADTVLVVISYVIVVVYVVLVLGNFSWVYGRFLLGFCGVALILLAIASGLGLAALFDLPFSPVTLNVLPYLLLGSGIDDLFIIVQAYNDTVSNMKDKPQKMKKKI